ncbi:MAG: DedA family protein [bacterium]|nr:DedA family protein [bacterium]
MHEIILHINQIFQSLGIQGLAINAGIESCLPGFPLPPDILLSAMDLANPKMALVYALICTVGSVAGGSFGYLIGLFGGRPIFSTIFKKNHEKFEAVEKMYEEYGSFAVFFSAFTPIPYNIFTIASGVLKMNFLKFLLASLCGRGGRFFLVSLFLMFFGETFKKYINFFIIALSILLVVFFVIVYKKRHALTNGTNKNKEE